MFHGEKSSSLYDLKEDSNRWLQNVKSAICNNSSENAEMKLQDQTIQNKAALEDQPAATDGSKCSGASSNSHFSLYAYVTNATRAVLVISWFLDVIQGADFHSYDLLKIFINMTG